jgi:hypothetical protein
MPVRMTALVTAFLLVLTTGWWSTEATARSPKPLNVVLLILDDARWDALGAAGPSGWSHGEKPQRPKS